MCAHFVQQCPAYVKLVDQFHQREAVARRILKFHAQVAFRFVQPWQGVDRVFEDLVSLCELDEGACHLRLPVAQCDDTFCPRYFKLVASWAPSSGSCALTDTSLLDLYLF